MTFTSIEDALRDIHAGKFVIVADDEDRENEGDLICAAELVTPAMVNFMIKKAGGLICLAMTGERVDELGLAAMAETNLDAYRTAYTVSIAAPPGFGGSTGSSARARAPPFRAPVAPSPPASAPRHGGHIFPLRAREG